MPWAILLSEDAPPLNGQKAPLSCVSWLSIWLYVGYGNWTHIPVKLSPHSSYGPVTFNGRNYSSSSRRSHCGSASRRQDIQYRPFTSVVPLTDPLVRQQREWTWSSVIRIPGVVYYSANISAFYYFATSNFFLLIYLPFRFSLLISSAAYKGIFGGGA